MTSPQPTDQKPRIDPVEALRVLVADLRALAERMALKEHNRSLQQTLKAAQERVSGPRAVVMLLGEHEDLKRRFLERLLGPNLAQVPKTTTVCTRLEYGAQPECSVSMPQGLTAVLPLNQLEAFLVRHADRQVERDTMEKTVRTIRLPNPTLKGDLAVIDTPIVESMEPAASLLECAAQANVWIFVLQADHELSEASYALLRRLPERGARLEMVVEGAEALNAEERLAARERLMRTLSERCNIEAPRLTLIASAATEGDAESFWHGRFATFHSVMMLRGRERSLEATRAVVAGALSAVGTEIDSELKSIGLGLRHARLRLGMKDLDGLRTRFHELRHLDCPPPLDANAAHEKAAAIQPAAGNLPLMRAEAMAAAAMIPRSMDVQATDAAKPGSLIDRAQNGDGVASAAPEKTDTSTVAPPFGWPAVVPEPTFVSFRRPTADARPKSGLAVNFSETLTRLVPRGAAAGGGKITLPQRIAGAALATSFVCLILWALAPRGFLFGHEAPSEWEYHPPEKAASASHVAPATTAAPYVSLPQPGDASSLPDPAGRQTPNIPAAPLRKRSAAIRTPLLRPIPSGAAAGVSRSTKRHHRHLLGLGKLWHWVRHPHRQNHPADQ
jgi:hypothetical protein